MLRYGRQLVLRGFGAGGQTRLKHASVLVIGAGGLGCPVLTLLAGAGVGRLGIVDCDVVELSNLHRQPLHTEASCGATSKVDSAKRSLRALNSDVKLESWECFLDASNAADIVSGFDVVVEASDSLASKYIANDVCARQGKAFVCGAAQGWEGQFALYRPGGPCFRCMFPVPPAPRDRASCADDGVLGPIPALVGALQALEVLRWLSAPDAQARAALGEYFFMFDGGFLPTLRKVKLPTSRPAKCGTCGPAQKARKEPIERFCEEHGLLEGCSVEAPPDTVVVESVTWQQVMDEHKGAAILDVRDEVQNGIWGLRGSVNVPLKLMQPAASPPASLPAAIEGLVAGLAPQAPVLVVCRRGIDSRAAVRILKTAQSDGTLRSDIAILSVRGGLEKLAALDSTFPLY